MRKKKAHNIRIMFAFVLFICLLLVAIHEYQANEGNTTTPTSTSTSTSTFTTTTSPTTTSTTTTSTHTSTSTSTSTYTSTYTSTSTSTSPFLSTTKIVVIDNRSGRRVSGAHVFVGGRDGMTDWNGELYFTWSFCGNTQGWVGAGVYGGIAYWDSAVQFFDTCSDRTITFYITPQS